jgi:hypothetical protein
MILTHESGAQEDQFDGKKRRPKISWYYPFKDSVGFDHRIPGLDSEFVLKLYHRYKMRKKYICPVISAAHAQPHWREALQL